MKDYTVNLSEIALNRRPGVSGMMRVRNDGEFIEASIESCIDALDELIIVYNDCTDDSPAIIENVRQRYPDKIKVFEYEPRILAWNLSDEQISGIMDGSIPMENTLAGYNNFALSKTECEYVVKIDADQIYNTPQMKSLCDCYRCTSGDGHLSMKGYAYLYLTKLLQSLSIRSRIGFKLLRSKKYISRYQKYLLEYIKRDKITVSLSGINVIVIDSTIYIPLGQHLPGGFNILGPFNGVGDTVIFRVTDKTHFEPIVNEAYNMLTGGKKNVIETFCGKERSWTYCTPVWLHLNACRKNIWAKTLESFRTYREKFVAYDVFVNSDYRKTLQASDEEIFSGQAKIYFGSIFAGITPEVSTFFTNLAKTLQGKIFDRLS